MPGELPVLATNPSPAALSQGREGRTGDRLCSRDILELVLIIGESSVSVAGALDIREAGLAVYEQCADYPPIYGRLRARGVEALLD